MPTTTRSQSASAKPASRAPSKKATTTRSQSASAKPPPRAQSKKATTTTSPIKKARAPARKRRASPPNQAKAQSDAQSNNTDSVHGSDGGAPSPITKARAPARAHRASPLNNATAQSDAPSNDSDSVHSSDNGALSPPRAPSRAPRILTVIHPSDRLLLTTNLRFPFAHGRLRLRLRRDLATHLPELIEPNERRIASLEGQVAGLQDDNNRLRRQWMEELQEAVETEELDFLREMVKAKQVAVDMKKTEIELRFEMMLRMEMKYD